MIVQLAAIFGLSAVSFAVLWPMLRMPVMLMPSLAGDVPNATFDYRGLT
jgi:hypothetical protein